MSQAPTLLGLPLPAAWAPRLEAWRARWARLEARERLGLQVAAAALLLLLVVLLFVNPALKTLREAPVRLAELDAQLSQMQAWAAEAQRLQQQPPVSPAQAAAALQAASDYLGADARLSLQGDRATLQFSQLSGEQIGNWLAEVRRAARARPVEAQLQRGPRGYGGSIVLALPGGATP